MSDAIRRAIRTLLWVIAAAVPVIPSVAEVFDIPAGQVAQVVTVLGGAVTVLTALINALEDAGKIPALLKAPASSGENPVPDA